MFGYRPEITYLSKEIVLKVLPAHDTLYGSFCAETSAVFFIGDTARPGKCGECCKLGLYGTGVEEDNEDQNESYVIFTVPAGEPEGFGIEFEEIIPGEKDLFRGVLGGKLTGVLGIVGRS